MELHFELQQEIKNKLTGVMHKLLSDSKNLLIEFNLILGLTYKKPLQKVIFPLQYKKNGKHQVINCTLFHILSPLGY